MTTDENKAIVRRWLEVWSTGDLGVLQEIIAPNFVNHVSGSTILPESGPEFYAQQVAAYRASFPDNLSSVDALIAEGDLVVCRFSSTATHLGSWGTPWGAATPPTGRRIGVSGITISRTAEGKIAEQWWEWDRLGLQEQLGSIPVAAAART